MITYAYPETMKPSKMYNLTMSPEIQKFSDHVGESINVESIIVREEGEKTITSIESDTGIVYATNSPTVANSIERAVDMGIIKGLTIISGRSRNGRNYIDVRIDEFEEE